MTSESPTPSSAPVRGTFRGRCASERTCVGCGKKAAPAEMIRVLVGDDGAVGVDLLGRGAGRGSWVHPSPECLAKAAPAGLSRSVRAKARVTPDALVDAIARTANARVDGLLASAAKSKALEYGSDAVRRALDAGRARLVLVACDARAAATTPWVLEAVGAGRAIAWGTKDSMGRCAGRGETGVVAVLEDGFADALRHAIPLTRIPRPSARRSNRSEA